TMNCGVAKSGSPAAYEMTGLPSALSALALASTFRVADSAMAESLRERGARSVTAPSYAGPPAPARRRRRARSAAVVVWDGAEVREAPGRMLRIRHVHQGGGRRVRD